MNIVYFCLTLAADSLFSHLVLYLYLFAVIDTKIQWKKLFKMLLIIILPATFIYYVTFLTLPIPRIASYIINSLCVMLFNTLLVKRIFKWNFWKSLSVICISAVLQVATVSILFSGIYNMDVVKNTTLTVYLRQLLSFYPLTAFCIGFIMKKLHFGTKLHYLLEDEKHIRITALLTFLLECSVEVFAMYLTYLPEESILTYISSVFILVLFIFCIFLYLSRHRENIQKLQMQETVLLQQQVYVESLEHIQKDVRTFRHDYKNMLSGMYLCAEEGQTEAIKTYLKNLEICFDEKIGENIRQTTQLGNVRILEVKGLILSKLTKMNEKQITCNLEILYPVTKVGINVLDFNRCLGILLDNAIEAVENTDHPVIDLILCSQEDCITITVKNPWFGELALHSIWREGYSTKGKNRGLGLSNYQHILEKYPNASPATSRKEHEFIQELKIIFGR